MAAEFIDDTETGSGLYPTKIPGYEDAADIQEALRLYHYGSTTIPTENVLGSVPDGINTKSIAGHLKALSNTDVANALVAANALAEEIEDREDADTNLQTQIDNISNTLGLQTSVVEKTSSFTLELIDASKTILLSTSSVMNLTIPSNSSVVIPVGYKYHLIEIGSGVTTFVPASGVTINSKNSQLFIDTQYGQVTLIKVATDSWIAYGDIYEGVAPTPTPTAPTPVAPTPTAPTPTAPTPTAPTPVAPTPTEPTPVAPTPVAPTPVAPTPTPTPVVTYPYTEYGDCQPYAQCPSGFERLETVYTGPGASTSSYVCCPETNPTPTNPTPTNPTPTEPTPTAPTPVAPTPTLDCSDSFSLNESQCAECGYVYSGGECYENLPTPTPTAPTPTEGGPYCRNEVKIVPQSQCTSYEGNFTVCYSDPAYVNQTSSTFVSCVGASPTAPTPTAPTPTAPTPVAPTAPTPTAPTPVAPTAPTPTAPTPVACTPNVSSYNEFRASCNAVVTIFVDSCGNETFTCPTPTPTAPTPVAPTAPTPTAPTPVAPTAPTPVAPTPTAPTPSCADFGELGTYPDCYPAGTPTPTAPTPVAPTPTAPTPVAPTPTAPTPVSPDFSPFFPSFTVPGAQ